MIWGKSGLIELTKNRLKSVGSSREWSSGDLKLERAKGIELTVIPIVNHLILKHRRVPRVT